MSQIKLFAAGPALATSSKDQQLPHVLFVVDGFPKALGGGERIVLRLASLLPRYGYRASILTFARHPESTFRPQDAPCPVYLLPLTNTYGFGALRGALALRRFLREQQVRVVQTFFESSDLWAGLVTRLFSPAKMVWSRRDMGILRGPKHALAYRKLRWLPHAVSAVSQRVADHVVEVDRVPASRVHVIYNGLDLAPVSNDEIPHTDTPMVITTVGNVRRVKGHDHLIAAAAEVIKVFPHAQFTIAGDVLEPEYFAQLEQQIAELGIGPNFRFVGRISDLGDHLKTATVFVLPSRSEGFSNALIEAMACGIATIATDVGGNAEAIQSGESGLIVPPEDPAALAAAMLAVLADPVYRQGLANAGKDRVAANFTADAMMHRVTELLSSLDRA